MNSYDNRPKVVLFSPCVIEERERKVLNNKLDARTTPSFSSFYPIVRVHISLYSKQHNGRGTLFKINELDYFGLGLTCSFRR